MTKHVILPGQTLLAAKRTVSEILDGTGFKEADSDAELLLFDACGFDRKSWFLKRDEALGTEEAERLRLYLERRLKGEPVQYITGKAWFYGRSFAVDPSVLIPRFDTEVCMYEALKVIRGGERVLDLCTGSGCIIITLALEKKITAFGSDISEKALITAKKNMSALGASCEFIKSDLFENVSGKYDIIISNPPYIRTDEIELLDAEVRDYEPVSALDGGSSGLVFYERIIEAAPRFLEAHGRLIFETGYDEAESVASMMTQRGFSFVCIVKDLSGHQRAVTGIWEK